MSQKEGLAKLTEYLNQTRRQAEASIDVLNAKINELNEDNEKLNGEKEYYRQYSEQLKLENSKKWRLQERDDWKSLVDSVQHDRSRLQEECARLEAELEQSRAEVKVLEEEIGVIHEVAEEVGRNQTSSNNNNQYVDSSSEQVYHGSPGQVLQNNGGIPHHNPLRNPHNLTVNISSSSSSSSSSGSGGTVGMGDAAGMPTDAVAFFSTPSVASGEFPPPQCNSLPLIQSQTHPVIHTRILPLNTPHTLQYTFSMHPLTHHFTP